MRLKRVGEANGGSWPRQRLKKKIERKLFITRELRPAERKGTIQREGVDERRVGVKAQINKGVFRIHPVKRIRGRILKPRLTLSNRRGHLR